MGQDDGTRIVGNVFVYSIYSLNAVLFLYNTSCITEDCFEKLNEKNDDLR